MEACSVSDHAGHSPTQYPELRCVMNAAMKHVAFWVVTITGFLAGHAIHAQHPVGSWRSHVPFEAVHEILFADGEVLARTPYALFSVDTATFEVTRFTKQGGLTDVDPTALGFDPIRQRWIVGYANGSIDLRDAFGTANIPDLRIAQIQGDKAINDIYVEGNFAYLATNFGVVVLDLQKDEIADTWKLTADSSPINAEFVVSHNNQWLVGTQLGIFTAPQQEAFLSNPERWQTWSNVPDLGPALDLMRYADLWWLATGTKNSSDIVVWRGDDNGFWEVAPGWNENGSKYGGMATGSWILNDDGTRSEGILVASCCQVLGWGADGSPEPISEPLPDFAEILDLVIDPVDGDGRVWLGSRFGGVIAWVPQPKEGSIGARTSHPSGPPSLAARRVDCWNDNLWVATGGVDAAWTPEYRTDGVFQFSKDKWFVPVLPENANDVDGVRDFMDVSIDPTDPTHVVFSSYEEGLIEVRNRAVVRVLNASNSSIEESLVGGSPRSAASGLDFDRQGNLWFTTPYTTNCLHVMLPDGSTTGMSIGDNGRNLLFGDVEVTRDGYVWVSLARGNGILVYNPSGTPDVVSDDSWVILTAQEGDGGLPSKTTYCIEEDLDGEIWVGTDNGPCVFYQSASVFEDDVTASQILISQDGNLQYLLETAIVQCILIDAGNRKWIGSRNSGLYVVSPDGLTTVHHFTEENSPLPSNDIRNLAMDYGSGEVYIATSKGLMSYTSGSSNWDVEMDNVTVRPNPVRSDHTGPIVFDGLANESSVHITDAAGSRIAVLQSEGGRATWDGSLESGGAAPFGIYLAFATDRNGKKGAVVKFAILR